MVLQFLFLRRRGAVVITFESGFKTLFGFQPFRWQSRLCADHFVTGDLPAGIDAPTKLGGTAVMGSWLLARAETSAPLRRPVRVVDRRAVVDKATDLAEETHERRREPGHREPEPEVLTSPREGLPRRFPSWPGVGVRQFPNPFERKVVHG